MKKTNFGFLFLFLVSVFLVSGAGVWAQANSNTAPTFEQQPSIVLGNAAVPGTNFYQ
jgi:hypothetical protein